MTNDSLNGLVYDGENHAVSATMSSNTSGTYTYDGNGLRVKRVSVVNNVTTTTVYVFSGSKVIAEYDNGAAIGSPSREYIYSGAALIAKIDSSGTKYYHKDHLSNRLVTDSSGNTLAQLGTFPYGESWYNASNDKFLFTTYERDSESGNDYAQARYDINRAGRFNSPDPIAGSTSDPQSLHRYSYVRNMPVMLTDPTGLLPGCGTVENRDGNQSQQQDSKTGGPYTDSSDAGDPANPPQTGCGHTAPCTYTLAGCPEDGGGGGWGPYGGPLAGLGSGGIGFSFGDLPILAFVAGGGEGGGLFFGGDPFDPSGGDIGCGFFDPDGSLAASGSCFSGSASGGGDGSWSSVRKDLILKVTSDCFNKDTKERDITYQLATKSGSPLVGSYNITEQQSDTSVTPGNKWGQSSNDPSTDGNNFYDNVRPGFFSSQTVASTQYFLVSHGGLGIAQWVPISRPGRALSMFNTIVMQGPASSNPNTVKINGKTAGLCGFI